MKLFLKISFALALLISGAVAQTDAPSFTLYPPRDKATGKYDERRACFNFKTGAPRDGKDWDIGYGYMALSREDWFILNTSNESRTVIRDLGELKWTDSFEVPALEPLPVLAKGERRHVTVDNSAGTHKKWASETHIHAKVVVGHIYVVHIKNEESDFYALFRVEDFEQGKRCTISWKLIPTPEK